MPGEIVAHSNVVIARDNFGRFIAECQLAGAATMRDMAEAGAALSREFAPLGAKNDPRGPHLKDAITSEYTSTTARWKCTARHALAVEEGSTRHYQTGHVTFWWENAGRDWRPGDNLIDHPAVGARPYLRPAYKIVMRDWATYARRHYPR